MTTQKFKCIIGSRSSPLAIAQVQEVISLFSQKEISIDYQHITFETQGDIDKTTPLSSNPADNFFTDTLDQALLKKEIDIALHSAKDVPKCLHPELEILALTECLDERDCLVANAPLNALAHGAKIGTSSQLRLKFLNSRYPHLQCVDIRGTIEERLNLLKSGNLSGIIVAACALKRLKLDSLIKEIFPWETTPLQGQLALLGRKGDALIKELCAVIDIRKSYGQVSLVGAGPGDPELITIKAIKALEKADCVFYDFLINKEILIYAGRAEKIYAGKRKGDHTMPQSELSRLLRLSAMKGKNVVRLKGGDPLIFGRGAEEISYLKDYHVQVSVIPGVSSATGIPASLGIPLTSRGISSSVTFLTAHTETEQIAPAQSIRVPESGTLVFLMGLTKLPMIVESLLKKGTDQDTPVILISKGTTPQERILYAPLKDILAQAQKFKLEPPVLIIVGKILQLWRSEEHLKKNNFPPAPILYLGTNPEKYYFFGKIIHHPLIEISPIIFSLKEREKIMEQLKGSDLVIFTSRFAVRYFGEILDAQGAKNKLLSGIDCAAIGEATAAALKESGIIPALVADVETSQGLFDAIESRYAVSGKKILFPRSALPNPFLKSALARLGAQVTELPVYLNRLNLKTDKLSPRLQEEIRSVLFSSPSTVTNFLEIYGKIPAHWRIFSRGARTKEALNETGYHSEVLIHE